MRKIYLLFLVLLLSMLRVEAQVASYSFSQSNGVYEMFTDGTPLVSAVTDNSYTNTFDSVNWDISFPDNFAFAFNGENYTGCTLNSNGYLTFGTVKAINTTNNPISSTIAYKGAISAWGNDMNGYYSPSMPSDVRWKIVGEAPNRQLVIQYRNVKPDDSTSITNVKVFSFQIKLYETTNVIKFIYDSTTNVVGTIAVSGSAQIGLRGAVNTDFINRLNSTAVGFNSSIPGTLSSSSQAFNTNNATPGMPSAGLTYTFTPPSCYPPSNIDITSTSNSAILTWEAPSILPANGYVYEVRTDTNPGTPGAVSREEVGPGVLTANIPNLNPNTVYNVYVRSNCGTDDLSAWSAVKTFRTLCAPVSTLPYVENFDYTESISLPYCWSKYEATANYVSIQTGATNATSGTKSLRVQSSLSESSFAISPQFTQNIETLRVKFNYKRSATTAGKLVIGILNDPTDVLSFIPLDTINPTNTSFNPINYSFNSTQLAVGANNYIALRQIDNTSATAYFYIDNFEVNLAPNCADITGLVAEDITANSVKIKWTVPPVAPSEGYQYEVRTSGAPNTGTDGLVSFGNVQAGSFEQIISQLSPNTVYTVYLKSKCGVNTISEWSDGVEFRTALLPNTLPYFENFNGANPNFAIVNGTPVNKWVISNVVANSTDKALYVTNNLNASPIPNTYTTSSYVNIYAYTDIAIPTTIENPYQLSFDYLSNGENTADNLQVWLVPTNVSFTASDSSTRFPVASTENILLGAFNGISALSTAYIDFDMAVLAQYAGQTRRLVFYWRNDSSSGSQPPAYVDNIKITPLVCEAPATIFVVSTLTDTSAQLILPNDFSGEYEYEIRTNLNVGQATTARIAAGVINATTSRTVDVTGLAVRTNYYVFLRKKCSSTEASAWVIKTFILRTSSCTPLVVPTTVENFEAYGGTITATSLPCWNEAKLTNGLLTYNTSDWTTATLNGTKVAQITLSGAKNDWLISPVINLSSNSGDLRLTYKSAVVLPTGATALPEDKSVKVLISTDGGETWNTNAPLKVYTGAQIPGSTFTNEEIDLAGYTGNVRFAFVATSTATTSGLSFSIDDFKVDTYPVCRDIPSVEYSQLTKNSVKVSWAQPSLIPTQGYQILVFAVDQTDLSDANVAIPIINVSNTTLEHVITGLTSSTAYKIFVRTNCGGVDFGAASNTLSFTTLCNYPDFVAIPTSIPTSCGIGTATLSAAATNNGSVAWYTAETGGTLIPNTNGTITPLISEDTSYWVQSELISPDTNVKVGNGTTLGVGRDSGNPIYSGNVALKTQYIFRKSELEAAGLSAGPITSIGLDLWGSSTYVRTNFSIRIASTNQNVATSTFINIPASAVGFTDNALSPISEGTRNFTFDENSSFVWDGESNIVVQFAFANSSSESSTGYNNSGVVTGATDFVSETYYYYFSTPTVSSLLSQSSADGTYSRRPNTYFNGVAVCSSPRTEVVATVTPAPILELSHPEIVLCEGDTQLVTITEGLSSYDNFVWEPTTGVTGDQTTGWTFAPTVSDNYKLIATRVEGNCLKEINFNVTVNPKPAVLPIQETMEICKDEIIELVAANETVLQPNVLFSFEESDLNNIGFVHSSVPTGEPQLFRTTNFTAETFIDFTDVVKTQGNKALRFGYNNYSQGFLTLANSVDLRNIDNLKLQFDNIAAFEGSSTTPADFGVVQFSTDGGLTWVSFTKDDYFGPSVANFTDGPLKFSRFIYPEWTDTALSSTATAANFLPTNSMWKTEKFAFPENTDLSEVKIRFVINSDTSIMYSGWFLDNIKFTGTRVQETTWSPVANLYTDAAATIPYVAETPTSKVYFKATEGMAATIYTAVTSNANCSVTQTTSITVIDVVEPVVLPQTICEVGVGNIVITDQNEVGLLKWYATEVSTEVISEILTTGTYYVERVVGNCKSDRVAVVITVNLRLLAPTTELTQLFCEETTLATVANLEATGTGTIGWFLNEDDELPLETTESLQTRTYYVAQFNGNCWSEKVAVAVESGIIPPVPSGGEQSFCGALALSTVPIQTVTGGVINWYDTLTSTEKLPLTDVISNRSYYISQSVGNCESERTSIEIQVIPTYEAPIADANQLFCSLTTFADLNVTLVNGATVGWFSSASLAVPDLVLSGNVVTGAYYVAQFNGACWSPKTLVNVTVNTKPANLNNATQQLCGVFTLADVTLGQVSGATVKFYATQTSTDVLPMTTALVSGTYYVSQTVGGCESDKVAVTFTVSDVLPAPQVEVVQLYCGPTIISNLRAIASQEGTIGWFTSLDSSEPLSGSSTVQTGTYYVSQRKNHCWSPKVAVSVTVNAIPALLNNTPQQLCGVYTLADAVLGQATGATLKFYTSASSTDVLPLTAPLVTGTYYVSQTLNGCESPRVSVNFEVAEILPAPLTEAVQFFCGLTTFANLEAVSSQNGVIGWFTTSQSTTPVSMSSSVQTGTYYVAQRNAHCWSPKVAVTVTVNPIPPTLNNASQNFCGNYRFADVNVGGAVGAVVNWYASENSTTVISLTEVLQSGTYYISQAKNGCESPRVPITIGVTGALTRPNAVTQVICGSGTIGDLEAQGDTGNTIVWFSSLTSSTPLAPTAVVSSGTYYVAQTRNGCYSERRAVAVRVVSLVAPQVAPFVICGSGVISDLYIPTATGTSHKWYVSPTSSVELPQNTPLTTGVYYVERVQNDCPSVRAAVQVTIASVPNAPTGVASQSFMEGATMANLVMSPSTVTWYATFNDSQSGTNPLAVNMPLVNNTTYYAVVIGTNGCPSLPFAVTVSITLSDKDFVKNELKYYPNPVDNILNISYSDRIVQVEVFDLLGKRVKSVATDDTNIELNLSDLASGTYMIQLKSESKQQFIKIVKK